tara:strand:- start:2681 stop:2914 length:234 start_codon:yes stop_codon:yes gene_type:complete
MAKIVKGYLDKISNLQTKIDKEADEILTYIDIDNVLANPQPYMTEFSRQFFESIRDELLEAIKAGEDKANKIMDNIE